MPLFVWVMLLPGTALAQGGTPAHQWTGSNPGSVVEAAIREVEAGRGPDLVSRLRQTVSTSPPSLVERLSLATALRLLFEYDEARRVLAEPDPDVTPVLWQAYAALIRGEMAQQRGRWREALPRYREAQAMSAGSGDRWIEAYARLRLATVLARTDGVPAQLAMLEEARAHLDADPPYLMAVYHCARAGRGGLSVEEDFARGLAFSRQAGIQRTEAACLHMRAGDLIRTGETDRALDVFAHAQRIQERIGDRSGRAAALQWAGYVLLNQGDYTTALAYLTEAVEEGTLSDNQSAVAWAHLNLGAIASNLGDLETATHHADLCETMMREEEDDWGLAYVTDLQGYLSFQLGLPKNARAQFEAAASIYAHNSDGLGLYQVQHELMDLALEEGDVAGARTVLDRIRTTVDTYGMEGWRTDVLFDEADLLMAEGRLAAAESTFLAYLRRDPPNPRRYRALARLAEIQARGDRLEEARTSLERAMDELEEWRDGLDGPALRTYAFQVQESIRDPDMGIATVIAALAEGGAVEAAFALAERQRARTLFERMVRSGVASGPGVPSATIDAVAALADVQSALTPDMAVLHYVTGAGGEPTTAFVITSATVRAVALPPAELVEEDIARLVSLLAGGADPTHLARRLGALILDPLAGGLPPAVDRVVVIPDGALHRVPFGVLRDSAERAWIETYAVTTVPSASVLASLRARPTRADPVHILAVGDPTVADGAPPVGNGGEPYDARFVDQLPPLPEARQEARWVSRTARDSELLLGSEATEAAFRQADLARASIVHFAGHAVVGAGPASGTVLVLAPGDGHDGLLTADEIGRLPLRADLAVLSACETAGGRLVRGEGLLGLSQPMLSAGVRTVVAGHWRVPDRPTRELIQDFYLALGRGLPVDVALRNA
ncbi:MAG TPA: CHAT domain-containing protein, partial [Longimicrobiales bacterium]|nr:CHAT domain-containing protein [Longimicrobiales bacterium]